ncbi:peptide MFS transporter [Parasphingopyxis marina]|uniref:Peptide MFS transporter n=1 Tax=Parasphingopyxis marina TaxID=2761622 RepID=A0A842HRM7_9SPHN|nr:peptide MFS transporter [Parasphingopyxis marina]MBC2776458.1 peptide MFS transporter [Parasphingopyxis marina]
MRLFWRNHASRRGILPGRAATSRGAKRIATDTGAGLASSAPPPTATFLGHPKGLAYLAMTEAWERFSFYGMRALLVLYMVQELLLPGHIENVAGMAALRGGLESMTGPLSTQAFASQVFGLYAGFVYFTPLFGGWIADRWLGAKKTVMIGIVLMTLGHFAMAFEVTVLFALTLLVLGSGCLKGNIAAQVGHLYPKADEARRTRGFTIFSTGINIGAVAGPVVCGLLAQLYGWHIGFGAAGLFMLVAALIYFSGMRHFAAERPRAKSAEPITPLERHERRMLGLIGVILVISLCQFLAYDQIFNVGMIWVSEQVDLATAAGTVPVPWFASLDSLASVLVVPLLILLWGWQARHGREPGDLGKIGIGAAVMAASMASLAVGSWLAGAGPAGIVFPLIAFTLSGVAFMWSWPTMLALVSRRAPAKTNALMMATVYLTAFVTGIGSGYIAGFYESMGATGFWILNSGISLSGAIAILLFGPALKRAMDANERETA